MQKPKLIQSILIVILALLCFKQFQFILTKSFVQTGKFIQAGFNYEQLRETYPLYNTIKGIKKSLPPNLTFKMVSDVNDLEIRATKYWLYPIKITDNAPYILNLDKENQSLWALKYLISEEKRNLSHNYPSLKIVLIFFAMTVLFTLIGFLVLKFLTFLPRKNELLWFLSTSYLMGFFICNTVIWIIMLFGETLTVFSILFWWSLILVICLFTLFSKKKPFSNNDHTLHSFPEIKKEINLFNRLINITLQFAFLFVATSIVLLIISSPLNSADSMGWILRAKVISFTQNLDLSYLPSMYNSYPLLWPINIATQFTLLNGPFDEVAKWTNALFFIILVIQIYKGLRVLNVNKTVSFIGVITFLAVFFAENPFNTGMPETPLLAFMTCCLIFVILWIEDNRNPKPLWISCFFACAVNLIKLEGMFFTLFVVISLFVTRKRNTIKISKQILCLLATMLLPILWIVWTKSQGYFSQSVHLQSAITFAKFKLLMKANFAHFINKKEWIIILLPAAYFTFFSYKRKWANCEIFLLSMTILLLLFKWFSTLFWPTRFITCPGIFPDGAWRLLLHVSPALIFLFVRRVINLRRRTRKYEEEMEAELAKKKKKK